MLQGFQVPLSRRILVLFDADSLEVSIARAGFGALHTGAVSEMPCTLCFLLSPPHGTNGSVSGRKGLFRLTLFMYTAVVVMAPEPAGVSAEGDLPAA